MNNTVFVKNLTTKQEKAFNIPASNFAEAFRSFVKLTEEYTIQFMEHLNFLNEHMDILKLNEDLLKLNELMAERCLEEQIVKVMLQHASDFDEVISLIENEAFVVRYNVDDWRDIAEQYVDEHDILFRIPEDLREYFDYEAYGRNLMTGSYRFWNSFNDSLSIQIF